jgi:DNA-directed RNA polymerase specialized sigma24 family protein
MLTYTKGYSRYRVARMMSCDEKTVRNNLELADHAIARWLDDRRAMRENARQRSQAATM